MRKPGDPRNPRPAVRQEKVASLDLAAVAIAVWLSLLVIVKFVENMPDLPAPETGQPWTMSALGT